MVPAPAAESAAPPRTTVPPEDLALNSDSQEVEEAELDPDEYSLTDSDSGTESLTWISWFCSLAGHEFLAEVAEEFIEDDFNMTGLNAVVPYYREAMEMILDIEPEEDSPQIPDISIVESSAELLYGMIHQRYILTAPGMQQMVAKLEDGVFGCCPRVFCDDQPVLPCGRSDTPGIDTVKLFCPNCMDLFTPASSRFHGIDGFYFGTTFPHLILQACKDLVSSPIASLQLRRRRRRRNSNESGYTDDAPADEEDLDHSPPPPQAEQGDAGIDESALGQMGGFPDGRFEDLHLPPSLLSTGVPAWRVYQPRIYGFRVSELARSGPRMRWMRARPYTYAQLMGQDSLAQSKIQPSPSRWSDTDGDPDDDPGEEEGENGDEDEEAVRKDAAALPALSADLDVVPPAAARPTADAKAAQ